MFDGDFVEVTVIGGGGIRSEGRLPHFWRNRPWWDRWDQFGQSE